MIIRWVIGVILVAAVSACAAGAEGGAPALERDPGVTPVRIAYTSSVFRDIHESDARAAIKVWSEATAEEMSIRTSIEVDVLPDKEALAELLKAKRIDFGGTTMLEFLRIEERLDPEPVFAVTRGGAPTVEYLLLVRRDGGPERLVDLKGADLRLFDNPRTSLALPWLGGLLAEQSLGSAEGFLGSVNRATKLSQVILPVFFGQADGCLVTRDGFLTMAELNPQVERDLRVLAQSPAVVPMVSFFRRDFTPPFRQEMIERICSLQTGATGRQLLELLQGDGIVMLSPTALENTRSLLAEWERRGTPETPQVAARRAAGRAIRSEVR